MKKNKKREREKKIRAYKPTEEDSKSFNDENKVIPLKMLTATTLDEKTIMEGKEEEPKCEIERKRSDSECYEPQNSEKQNQLTHHHLYTRPKPRPPSPLVPPRTTLLDTEDDLQNPPLTEEWALQDELTNEMLDMTLHLKEQALSMQKELHASVQSLDDVDGQLDVHTPKLQEENKRLTELNRLSTFNCLGNMAVLMFVVAVFFAMFFFMRTFPKPRTL